MASVGFVCNRVLYMRIFHVSVFYEDFLTLIFSIQLKTLQTVFTMSSFIKRYFAGLLFTAGRLTEDILTKCRDVSCL